MKKIVIVEDNATNMKLFVAILKPIPDLDIYKEGNGGLGLKMIETIVPDVIVLDIQLPTMSGIEICKELRQNEKFKKVPIVAVTAYAMKGDNDRILDAGFDRYLSKPVNVSEFRELIKKYLKI